MSKMREGKVLNMGQLGFPCKLSPTSLSVSAQCQPSASPSTETALSARAHTHKPHSDRIHEHILKLTIPLLLFLNLSRVRLFVTPRTIACQAPLSMRFPRQEY